MKVAISLFGYFQTVSTGKNNGFESCNLIHNFLNQHSIKDVDFYIHSWDVEYINQIERLYSPKKIYIEPQIDFHKVMEDCKISQEYFDKDFDRKNSMYHVATIYKSLSSFFTREKSLKLIDNFSQYDWVFSMRLDIGNVGPSSVNFPHTFKFNFDNNYIYSPMWEQINCGLGDMWTILNSEHAKKLSTIYKRILEYYLPNSDYVKLMTEGWPYSEWHDFDSTDKRQFSNVLLSGKKTKLMKYPLWYCVNNHTLYKYFFYENNLLEKIKFI